MHLDWQFQKDWVYLGGDSVLFGFPESDSETRIQEQVVYLGADPREVYLTLEKRDREVKKPIKDVLPRQLPLWEPGLWSYRETV